MAPPKGAPLLLALALALSLLVLASTAARNDQQQDGEGPGGGFFGVPWFGGGGFGGGGWGGGRTGGGGYARRPPGVELPSTVCMDKGPCYKKKLTCPARCFRSFSFKGQHGGGGGGGGGCSFDCAKGCQASC